MGKDQLLHKYELLPQKMKKEVQDFIEFLLEKAKTEQKHVTNENSRAKKYRSGFGSLKGKIKISEDFDEPLKDFKEIA